MAEGDVYTHQRQAQAEILANGGTPNEARWFSTAAWWDEREQLSRDAEFRTDAPVPHAAYEGYEHRQLKEMVTEGLSVNQVGDVSEAWSKLANAMARFAERLHEQITRSDTVWQGEAAETAKAYTQAMARWSDDTGQCAQLVSHQVSMQADAANGARHRMPEPVPFDLRQEMSAWPQQPQNLNTLVQQTLQRQQTHQDAKQEAVVVMTDYDEQLHTAAARQPVFPPPPRLASARTPTAAAEIPPANVSPMAGDANSATTAASFGPAGGAGFGPTGGTGFGPTGGDPPGRGRGPAPGAGVNRTTPAMPFHSGGAGVPAAGGPAGAARPMMPPGFMGAPGTAARRGGEDTEHTNSYVVEDWDETDWYDDLPRPVTPVIGSDVTPPASAKPDGSDGESS